MARSAGDTTRLDDAARAGWLYYVAGNTQDEIARKLGVSRQSAQRLVSLAVSERLIKFRLDHPIANCIRLSAALTDKFGLRLCEVVPTDPGAPDLLQGVAAAAATVVEEMLKSDDARVIALGTGRALKATVEQVPRMECPQHRLVSRLGNMMADGAATPYNATIRLAERVGARHYPFPLPVLSQDPKERAILQRQESVRNTMSLCRNADMTLVGVGQMDATAPLVVDGFMPGDELQELTRAGAVGEITSWVYDSDGHLIDCAFSRRVNSAPLAPADGKLVIAVSTGPAKLAATRAALRGQLVNGLITSESMAEALLAN
jgi:DNA-binding transcriptional regulator LsrR (DeoR family)